MNENKGSIDGSRDRRIRDFFLKFKKSVEQFEKQNKLEKEKEEKQKKEKEAFIMQESQKRRQRIIDEKQKVIEEIEKEIIEQKKSKSNQKNKIDLTDENITKYHKGIFKTVIENTDVLNSGAANYNSKNKSKDVQKSEEKKVDLENSNKKNNLLKEEIKNKKEVIDNILVDVEIKKAPKYNEINDIFIEKPKIQINIDNTDTKDKTIEIKENLKNTKNLSSNKVAEEPFIGSDIVVDLITTPIKVINDDEKKESIKQEIDNKSTFEKFEPDLNHNEQNNIEKNKKSDTSNSKQEKIILDNKGENKEKKIFGEDKNLAEIILEEKIVKHLETMLKDNRYKINKLISEYNVIKDDVDKVQKYDDSEKMSEELEILIEKIENIKKEIELLYKSTNFDKSYLLDDNYIQFLIDEYRKKFNNGFEETVLDSVRDNNLFKAMFTKINKIEKYADELSVEVNEKLDELKNRDENFDLFKKSLEKKDENLKAIDTILKESDSLILELEDKIANSEHFVERVEFITRNANNHMDALLLGFTALSSNPLMAASSGLLLRAYLMATLLNNLFGLNQERVVHRELEVYDYEKYIRENLSSLDDVTALLNKTCEQISELKNYFNKYFAQYDLPEFKEALEKINNIETSIDERKEYLAKNKKEINRQLELNNAKVLRRTLE